MNTRKKNSNRIGRGKPVAHTVEVEIYKGAIIIDAEEHAVEVLELMEAAEEAIGPVLDFMRRARVAATEYQRTHALDVVQLDDHYWRLIQRYSQYFVATPDQMPTPKPKGAKSLKEIVKDKTANGKPLWNFITRRVPDTSKIDLAVKKGYLTTKELDKAYVEKPQAPFIQRFDGEALVAEDED